MAYGRLKELRETKSITQNNLSKFLEVSRSAYQNYECGLRGIPLEVLSRIADYYGTSTDYLLGRTDIIDSYPRRV